MKLRLLVLVLMFMSSTVFASEFASDECVECTISDAALGHLDKDVQKLSSFPVSWAKKICSSSKIADDSPIKKMACIMAHSTGLNRADDGSHGGVGGKGDSNGGNGSGGGNK